MTIRITVSILAVAAVLLAPGLRPAGATPAGWRLAETATPLVIPAEPSTGTGTTTGTGAGAATEQAPAAGAAQPAAPAAPAASTATPSAEPPGTPAAQTPSTEPATPPATPPAEATPATPPAATTPQASPAPDQPASGQDDGSMPQDEELSLGEVPVIETIELTPDLARRALDSYISAKEKYANSDLDQYENLQDFVDQTDDGKKFDTDVKAAGFANVSDWNLAVTTLGLTYGSVVDDQSADLLQQIKEVEADTEMAQDIKDRMVKALKALIPSENNKKVVQDMMNDPVYGEKLKLLDIEEE